MALAWENCWREVGRPRLRRRCLCLLYGDSRPAWGVRKGEPVTPALLFVEAEAAALVLFPWLGDRKGEVVWETAGDTEMEGLVDREAGRWQEGEREAIGEGKAGSSTRNFVAEDEEEDEDADSDETVEGGREGEGDAERALVLVPRPHPPSLPTPLLSPLFEYRLPDTVTSSRTSGTSRSTALPRRFLDTLVWRLLKLYEELL